VFGVRIVETHLLNWIRSERRAKKMRKWKTKGTHKWKRWIWIDYFGTHDVNRKLKTVN